MMSEQKSGNDHKTLTLEQIEKEILQEQSSVIFVLLRDDGLEDCPETNEMMKKHPLWYLLGEQLGEVVRQCVEKEASLPVWCLDASTWYGTDVAANDVAEHLQGLIKETFG